MVLVKALLVIVILAGVGDVVATVYLGRKVKLELQQIAASGGIVNFMDGVPPPVAEKENAAPLYLKAAEILEREDEEFAAKRPRPAERKERYDIDFADQAELAMLTPMLKQDAEVLELLRRATAMPKCRFDTNWEDVFNARFPHYAKMRRLARFLRAAVVEAALRGDAAEALERARMGFVISRRMLNEPVLIAQLVAYAVDTVIERGVMCVLERGWVPEDAAKRLADELARDDLVASFVKSMQMERAGGIWFFDQVRRDAGLMGAIIPSDGAKGGGILRLVASRPARPLLYADELVYLRVMEEAIERARKPWRQARWDEHQARADRLPIWAPVARILVAVFTRVAEKRDQAVARRALMTTALAIEVYRQKKGRLPESLTALAAEVPWARTEDVFSGKGLVYRRKAGGYLLYSVGPNLKDDGGEPMVWQKKALGLSVPLGESEPDAGDLVWLPGLWDSSRR